MNSNSLKRLWLSLDSQSRYKCYLTIFLASFSALAELFTVALAFPFLMAIASPDLIKNNKIISNILNLINVDIFNTLYFFTLTFCIAVILAGIIRFIMFKYQCFLCYRIGLKLSNKIYENIVNQDFSYHTSTHTNTVVTAISTKMEQLIGGILLPLVNLISASIMFLIIALAIASYDYRVAIIICIIFYSLYKITSKYTKLKIQNISKSINIEYGSSLKVVQESLLNIREIIIDDMQPFYAQIFNRANTSLRDSQAKLLTFSGSTRYIFEPIGFIVIAIIAFATSVTNDRGIEVIAILGILALAMQKLLPLFQQIITNKTLINGSNSVLNDVLELCELRFFKNNNKFEKLEFKNIVKLNNIFFKHQDNLVLNDINLKIHKGDIIGLIGKTGSGKSTLLDLTMGLLNIESGKLTMDGVAINFTNVKQYQKNISHVPQVIYLADLNIYENIAMGLSKDLIDYDFVRKLCKLVELSNDIEKLSNAYNTRVGERGLKISGGQRQRIGIARALYKRAPILILDEATSALDEVTESCIMKNIRHYFPGLTIIHVTHRDSILSACNRIYRIEGGMLKLVK